MPRHVDKLWITNLCALRGAYGSAGLAQIRAAVADALAGDRTRGLGSRLVDVSAAATARALGVAPVDDPADRAAMLAAVNAAAAVSTPDYLVLLGGPHVLPHQPLRNPAFHPGDDPERTVASDLPYATGSSSDDPADHVGPTRVVGRLPDLPGQGDATLLVELLRATTRWQRRARARHLPVFGLTTAAWADSTRLTLEVLPGRDAPPHVVPPQRPPWRTLARHRTVLANVHGATADPAWYGDDGTVPLPVALIPDDLAGRVAEGAVVGSEACFGAELYDPALAAGRAGLATAWLAAGAVALVGSTTTSYGGVDESVAADVLVGAWLAAVLDGASTGRGLLAARHQLATRSGELDPVDLKTLAQFLLLGDPSVHPVVPRTTAGAPSHAAAAAAHGRAASLAGAVPAARAARRATLAAVGSALETAVLRPRARVRPGPAAERVVALAGAVDPAAAHAAARLAASGSAVRSLRTGARGTTFHLIGGAAAAGRDLVVVRIGADGLPSARRLRAR